MYIHRLWFRIWWTRSRSLALTIVKSRPHFFIKLLVLSVNLVLLMSLHYPLNHTFDNTVCESQTTVLVRMYYTCIYIYACNMCIYVHMYIVYTCMYTHLRTCTIYIHIIYSTANLCQCDSNWLLLWTLSSFLCDRCSYTQLHILLSVHLGESVESVCPGSAEIFLIPVPSPGHYSELDIPLHSLSSQGWTSCVLAALVCVHTLYVLCVWDELLVCSLSLSLHYVYMVHMYIHV